MTKQLCSLALLTAGFLGLSQPAQASMTFNLTSGFITDFNGVNTVGGTLFQLVNLGANGVFDGINIADGSASGLDRWVSGDDTVISAMYLGSNQDFATLAAFDHTNGSDTDGILNRSWIYNAPVGTKFGVRWFPGLKAADFAQGITLQAGQQFGQFTRQATGSLTPDSGPAALYNGAVGTGSLWVYTNDGDTLTLNALRTTAAGGTENNDLGRATYTVVPEPATLALALVSGIGILGLRRRRA